MAHAGKALELALPYLRQLPETVWFDTLVSQPGEPPKIELQAETQAELQGIQAAFRTVWKRTWETSINWWEYRTVTPEGLHVRIYGVREAPSRCKAITEKRQVQVEVPTAFETKTEEKEVIVGWDCGNGVHEIASDDRKEQ